MRKVTNLFLSVFVLTAILGVFVEFLCAQGNFVPLTNLRNITAILCVLLGSCVYFGFAFNRHLPKLLLLPLLFSMAWSFIDFRPLEFFTGDSYRLYAATGQLLLGLLILQLNLLRNKKSRLLVPSQFAGPGFSRRNFFCCSLINIPLLPLLLVLISYAAADSLIEQYSAGFMRLKPNGLYMIEKSYQRDGRTIRLAGMIHLGQPDYYRDLIVSIEGTQAIVLTEGVTDQDGRLQGDFSYEKIAELLGLTSQEDVFFRGRLVTAESLEQLDDLEKGKADILRADIDLKEFNAYTIAVLNALGKYLLNNDSLATGYRQFNRWAAENTHPESNRIIMADLLDKRNAAVLSYLPQALQKYRIILIPWGALHMPGIEQAIIEQGFCLQESRERLSIDFLMLPYDKLWHQLSKS